MDRYLMQQYGFLRFAAYYCKCVYDLNFTKQVVFEGYIDITFLAL